MGTDGRTSITELRVAYHNFANAPNRVWRPDEWTRINQELPLDLRSGIAWCFIKTSAIRRRSQTQLAWLEKNNTCRFANRNCYMFRPPCEFPRLLYKNMYRGADKSLARQRRKQANISVRMAWVSFGALPCRGKKKTSWQLASRCCWNRGRPRHASELVSFLVGLRTYQHPGTIRY